jgi:molybdopterin-guanine dinucleotide biosynthesis protein A
VAYRLTATGILLVGGASERFGSPKALAPLRGETLAERAWRILEETCDEVIAVGKAADGLELPFAVLDDSSDERAPVFGVIAGLRAAAHETCLVLPVDCPLVTTEVLRGLIDARAVPQTGPLPGVYTKPMLGDLEVRVASGELALRGVNDAVLDVDEKQLLNVNTRMDLLAAAVADWARSREDVRAALLVGSQARSDAPADRWSDLDIGLFVDDPSELAGDETWVEEFGAPVLTFIEPTPFGRVERRVLYEGGEDVDFPLIEASAWRELASSPEVRLVLARGYRVLHDELGLEAELGRVTPPEEPWPLDAAALEQLTSAFWYHALWTAKKLRRGEVYTAIGCLDGYLKARLVTLLAWHARAIDPAADTWHEGRFLERWADSGALAALERAYAHYDLRDVARALWETIDLFQAV